MPDKSKTPPKPGNNTDVRVPLRRQVKKPKLDPRAGLRDRMKTRPSGGRPPRFPGRTGGR